MACRTVCKMCDRFVVSEAVTFSAPNLVIRIPEGDYDDRKKYCVFINQNIPNAATITAPVFIQIGEGPVLYPVTRCDCTQLSACGVKTRTRYSMVVRTTADGGTFRLLGKVDCYQNNLRSINGEGVAVTTRGEA